MDRPRGLAAVDAARPRAGRARPAGRAPHVRAAPRRARPPARPGARRTSLLRRPRLDRFELVTLAALFALSFAVLAGLLVRVWTKGGIVTGSDGFLVVDQLQYLNWLRRDGRARAVGNVYDLEPGPRSFVHPGVLISGLLHRLGLGRDRGVRGLEAGRGRRAVRRGAGLDARASSSAATTAASRSCSCCSPCSPVAALVGWSGVGDNRDKFDFDFSATSCGPGNWLWGYLFTAIAVAAAAARRCSPTSERRAAVRAGSRGRGRRALLRVAPAVAGGDVRDRSWRPRRSRARREGRLAGARRAPGRAARRHRAAARLLLRAVEDRRRVGARRRRPTTPTTTRAGRGG